MTPAPNITLRDLFREPALQLYALSALGALAVLSLLTYAQGNIVFGLLLALFGLPGVLWRWRAAPLLVFVTLFGAQVFQQAILEGRSFGRPAPRLFEPTDMILCAAMLVFLLAHYRLQGLTTTIFPSDPRYTEDVPGKPGDPRPVTREQKLRRTAAPLSPLEVAFALLTMPLAVLAAQVVWLLLGRPWALLGMQAESTRLILLGWVLLVGTLVVAALLGHWRQRQMTATEAQQSLQDALWQEIRNVQRH